MLYTMHTDVLDIEGSRARGIVDGAEISGSANVARGERGPVGVMVVWERPLTEYEAKKLGQLADAKIVATRRPWSA